MTAFSSSIGGSAEEAVPNFVLTRHYGILSNVELKKEAKKNANFFWQCFPNASVSVNYDKWRGPDPMGQHDKVVTMCLFGINAKHQGIWSEYIGRRANRIEVCTALVENWNKLTKGEKFVCVGGEGSQFEAHKKGHPSWTWIKFKTKKGCYAYFPTDCS